MKKKFFDLSLYLIADSISKKSFSIPKMVEESVKGGCTIIQLREKNLNKLEFIEIAKKLKIECEKYNIPLIINDDFEGICECC
jgi:thiamine-phosphate pyrophosphorylase